MSVRQKRIAWGTIFCTIAAIGVGWSIVQAQQANTPAVETLLPAESVVYFGMDGMEKHKEAWENSAAYEALYETGLMEAIEKLGASFNATAGPDAEAAQKAFALIKEKGISLAIGFSPNPGPPIPYATLVLHEAAQLEPGLQVIMQEVAGGEIEFAAKEVEGRNVTAGMIPTPAGLPIELGWWAEGSHLVIAAGMEAVNSTIAVADGKSPNITTSEVWKKYRGQQPDFEMSSLFWFDFAILRNKFGAMPLPTPPPQQVTVDQILTALGLDKMGAIACQSGYKGKAQWIETTLEAPGPRSGLLALGEHKPITLNDLPPLPFGNTGFVACSSDWGQAYEGLIKTIRDVTALGPPEAAEQVDGGLQMAQIMLGFDPKTELLDPLGDISCLYGDNRQGMFGMGVGLVFSVDDAATLRKTFDKILEMAQMQAPPGQLSIARTAKQGREIVTLEIGGGVFNPSFAIDDDWMSIGLFPQVVEAFFLRVDGKLTKWKPTRSYQQAFDELPKEFVSISASDPRKMYRFLVGLAPALLPAMQAGIRQSGLVAAEDAGLVLPEETGTTFTAADLPPAELVGRPLFPNVAVCTVDEAGFHWTSRSSLPSIPLLDGGGGVPIATAGVLAALLLPAVQQAREAARRTQSKNNLKQILLALHNFHDVNRGFPRGTLENEKLKPEERLSWLVDVLPYLEQAQIHELFDKDQGWEAEGNQDLLQIPIGIFLNPGVADVRDDNVATTHYVGIGGLGKKGPTLPVDDKKAGVFAYDRVTRIRDIRDGTSNTVAVSEASKDFGPWVSGGKATIRALTTKPYINGPDGIGGPFKGGCQMGLSDGSVRFVSENIDPSVLEALSTINGGERIGDF